MTYWIKEMKLLNDARGMNLAISVARKEALRILSCFQQQHCKKTHTHTTCRVGPIVSQSRYVSGRANDLKYRNSSRLLNEQDSSSIHISLLYEPPSRNTPFISSNGFKAEMKLRCIHNDAKQKDENKELIDDDNKTVTKKDGMIIKLKNMVNSFWLGCKQLLWIDARKAWATKKKLKHHNYDLTILTREELRHMRQTKKDIFKSLPVAVLFFVPFVGYLAPVIGFLFPKKLLSHQFWNTEQMKKFAFEDYVKRSQYYLSLIQELGWSSRELKNQQLFKLCIKAIDKVDMENDELLMVKDIFQQKLMTVDGMPRFHLEKLCKTWLLPVKWYIPGKILREYLAYRIKQIIEDDQAIRREGITTLTNHCIRQACHARGLDKYSSNIEKMKEWLVDWLNLTTNLTDKDISFIAHCAVFKTINFEQDTDKSSQYEAEDEEAVHESDI